MSVQEGHQYPAVTRVLKPGSSEWTWYDNGGTYPYPGDDAIVHELFTNFDPVRNIVDDTFDLVVDSNKAGEQIYAAVFASAVDAEDPVTVRDGRGALWAGGQTSVFGENIFNVTGVVPAGRFYGFAQEDYKPKDEFLTFPNVASAEFTFEEPYWIPTCYDFSFHLKFIPQVDYTTVPDITDCFRLMRGTIASPTTKLTIRYISGGFQVNFATYALDINIPNWEFAAGVPIDVRFRMSREEGATVWLDGVEANEPAAVRMSGACQLVFLPAEFDATYQYLRFVNSPLTKAEIEAWT